MIKNKVFIQAVLMQNLDPCTSKTAHVQIISLRRKTWTSKASLTRSHFIEMPVSSPKMSGHI